MISGLSTRYDLVSGLDASEPGDVRRLIGDRPVSHGDADVSLYDVMQDGMGVLLEASPGGGFVTMEGRLNFTKFETFDMRKRLCFSEAWSRTNRSVGACIDDYVLAAEVTLGSIVWGDFYGSWSDETFRAHDKFSPTVFVRGQMGLNQTRHHFAFALTDNRHVEPKAVPNNPGLFAPAHVGSNLSRVNDVLARQAGKLGHDPPTYFFSTIAARCPLGANVSRKVAAATFCFEIRWVSFAETALARSGRREFAEIPELIAARFKIEAAESRTRARWRRDLTAEAGMPVRNRSA